jgi:hypothetical protein
MPTGGQVWFTRSKPASGSSTALPVRNAARKPVIGRHWRIEGSVAALAVHRLRQGAACPPRSDIGGHDAGRRYRRCRG